jgi:hypothetical protein
MLLNLVCHQHKIPSSGCREGHSVFRKRDQFAQSSMRDLSTTMQTVNLMVYSSGLAVHITTAHQGLYQNLSLEVAK